MGNASDGEILAGIRRAESELRATRDAEVAASGFVRVTTEPSPRAPAFGADAGQRGWKLHIVEGQESDSFKAIRWNKALCGLTASHGWGLDMFIDAECERCTRAFAKRLAAQAGEAQS